MIVAPKIQASTGSKKLRELRGVGSLSKERFAAFVFEQVGLVHIERQFDVLIEHNGRAGTHDGGHQAFSRGQIEMEFFTQGLDDIDPRIEALPTTRGYFVSLAGYILGPDTEDVFLGLVRSDFGSH